MPANTKAIRQRIKSVKSTKKITKAMELVSAAKMRRAIEAALNTRTYAALSRELMDHLSELSETKNPLLKIRPVQRMLVVLITSNRGLCGSFNSNIFRKTKKILDQKQNIALHRISGTQDVLPADGVKIDIIGVGRKSASFAKKHGYDLVAVFDHLADKPSLESILSMSKMIIDAYTAATYDKVVIAYTDYQSSIFQEPKFRQLLPLSSHDIEKMITGIGRPAERPVTTTAHDVQIPIELYTFEPGLETILSYVLPRLVETQLFQAVLESAASEHSARMLAMRNATDAASEMIDELNISYNKVRQAAITQEIAEIAGGAAALGN